MNESPHQGRLPEFVFVGFPRTGSQFTMKCLGLHPELDFRAKPRYFNVERNFQQGPEYYRSIFADAREGCVVGEGDEHYLSAEPRFASPEEIARRIYDQLPHARILICLRNQVDFLLSGFRYWKRSGISANFDAYMNGWPEEGVAFARIADFHPYVRHYVDLFGRGAVHILLHEDLAANPRAYLTGLYQALGVDGSLVDGILEDTSVYRDVNPAPSRRLSRLFDAANALRMRNPRVFRWIFPVRLYRALTAAEYRLFGSRTESSRALLTPQDLRRIAARYGPGNRALSDLIGIDLQARGYPG